MSTIYLTNAASRTPPWRGPGQVYTIMAAPRMAFGEWGAGRVEALTPPLPWVQGAKAGTLPIARYRADYLNMLSQRVEQLAPGQLVAHLRGTRERVLVADGDTLICACSKAKAKEGQCHRCWSAIALHNVGWSVILDGEAFVLPSVPPQEEGTDARAR